MLNIYLTGFMGSGKSTIGALLAERLEREFVDIDLIIEERAGQVVSDIFKVHGEPYFRSIEKKVVADCVLKKGLVVSLGGGTLMVEDNLEQIKASGNLLYLSATADEIWNRINNTNKRPLLQTEAGELIGEDEAMKRIEILLKAREDGYNKADIVIPISNLETEEVVNLTLERLNLIK
ncbi:MAG: shikimate kinase [bacterium]|nr:shikimate kinase [bacterium]